MVTTVVNPVTQATAPTLGITHGGCRAFPSSQDLKSNTN
jgi:hypothetical protein